MQIKDLPLIIYNDLAVDPNNLREVEPDQYDERAAVRAALIEWPALCAFDRDGKAFAIYDRVNDGDLAGFIGKLERSKEYVVLGARSDPFKPGRLLATTLTEPMHLAAILRIPRHDRDYFYIAPEIAGDFLAYEPDVYRIG